MSPMAEAAGQAREGIRRKKPLLLGPLLFGSDAAAEPAPSPSAYAIPVHRTFIEFGCLEQTPTSGHWRMLTAPASMAHPMRADLEAEAAAAEVVYAPGRNSAGADGNTVVAGPPGSAASSTRQGSSNHSAAARDLALPAVTYRLSPTSARASGYATWGGLPRAKEGSGEQPDCDSGSTDASGDFSEEDEDLGICPEYSEGAALPSLGSAGHGEGTCRRCCFFPKGRCNNGDDCTFCHFAHEKRKPRNKKKNKHNKRRARKNRNQLLASGVMDMEPFLGVSQVPMGAALIECMGPNIHIVMDESMEGQAVALVPVSFCTYCT